MPDICLWNRCNNNCIMCTNPPGFQGESSSSSYTAEKIIDRLLAHKDELIKKKDPINLTGGEPTIHPRFVYLIRRLRDIFPDNKIVIATNGRRFYYSDFTEKVLEVPNLSLEIAIHDTCSDGHDAITRSKGSFEQTVQGLGNILDQRNPRTHDLELRVIIIRQNYRKLNSICKFIYRNFSSADNVVLVFQEIEGVGEKNQDLVGLTHLEAKKYVQEAAENWGRKFSDFRLYHFPLCTLDTDYWKYTWRTLRGDEITYIDCCADCLYQKYCLGIHRGYIENIGTEEFTPIRKGKRVSVRENNYYHPFIESE